MAPFLALLRPDVLDEPYDFYRTLRKHAPVWVVPGTDVITVSTFELISDLDIPRGSTVLLLCGSANRDPAQFDNPDSVDLSRRSPRDCAVPLSTTASPCSTTSVRMVTKKSTGC